MARFLALDWDHNQLRVVAASVGGGAVRVHQAVVWQEERSPNPADAEALGRRLRERLQAAGIAPAPVLVCLGRDRVILKDIRFPPVPAEDEPNIVRFQAVKELTNPAEEAVIDYIPIGEPAATERRALALILRRELLITYQTLCKAAGLKLAGLTPRPFGTAACLAGVAGSTVLTPVPQPPDATVAVLTTTERWAEFCVVRDGELLFARALANPAVGTNGALVNEIRRNLAVYAGQTPHQPVRALYVAADGEQGLLRDRLLDTLAIPVYGLDPFAGAERPDLPASQRGGFTGVIGLLHAQGQKAGLPINFVRPKEPKPPKDPNRRRVMMAAGLAAALLIGVVAFGYAQIAGKDRELQALNRDKLDLDAQLVPLEDDAQRIKVLGDWTNHQVVWLDELYDLTDHIPDIDRVRITQFSGEPLTLSDAQRAKTSSVAKLSLKGITANDTKLATALMDRLADEPQHYHHASPVAQKSAGFGGLDRFRFPLEFTLSAQIERQTPRQYVRRLKPPAAAEDRRRDQRPGNFPDMFGGFGGEGRP